ncbi:MAG: S-layer homology domain-containing protein, partial [Eubacteriales bacterium]
MKKLLPLVLTLSVSLCLASPSHAAQAEIEQVITALEIMQGDHTGNLNLQNPVNRAEFITMSVNLLLGKNQVSTPTTSPYPDVSRDHWSAPYVVAGVQYELIAGYADGTFRPGNQITLGEASVIIPKLLGYTTADFSGVSMEGRVLWMATNDMLDNVTVSGAYDALTRYDTMHLFYNALTASTKQGTPLITTMGYPVTASGEIDRVALLTSTMEGPLQATLNWQSSIPITNYLAISINGTPSNASDIRPNDLIYWSTPARTLWVYRSQITGILGAVSPNNTVTISNNTYAIETEQATYALSSLGSFRQGDLVTALLGRDGGIAVISTPMAGVDSVCGLVLARTTTSYDDGA